MPLSMQDANTALANVHTEAELRTLISNLDVTATGNVTLLYSGYVGEGIHSGAVVQGMLLNGESIRVIDSTEAAKFLDFGKNEVFNDALVRIFGDLPSDTGQNGIPQSDANKFLFGGADSTGTRLSNGAWDYVSTRFVDATVGEVRTLTGNAGADRVFAQTEVSRVLASSGITHVDGIPIEQLKTMDAAEAFKTISAQSAIDAAYLKIATDGNGAPLIVNGQARLDTRDYFASTPGIEGKVPTIETPMRNMSEYITPTSLEAHREGTVHLQGIKAEITAQSKLPGIENAALRATALKALNRLGIAGDVLALALVGTDANAAYASGDTAKATQIMRDWALDFAGGLAGGLLAAQLVGSALAPLYLAGPAGAVIAGALTLLAGIAGSIFGGHMAIELNNPNPYIEIRHGLNCSFLSN